LYALRSAMIEPFMGPTSACITGMYVLARHPANAGLLSADCSRKRVAPAPAMVRAKRHGGSSGGRLWVGGEECALPLPGQAAASQGGAVLSPASTLGRFVRGEVRCAAVRPHQHLFRVAAAGGQTGQAPLRLQPR